MNMPLGFLVADGRLMLRNIPCSSHAAPWGRPLARPQAAVAWLSGQAVASVGRCYTGKRNASADWQRLDMIQPDQVAPHDLGAHLALLRRVLVAFVNQPNRSACAASRPIRREASGAAASAPAAVSASAVISGPAQT